MVFNLIGGILGGIGSLFGGDESEQSFDRRSETESEASSEDLAPELLSALENLFTSTVGGGGFEQGTGAQRNRLTQLGERAAQGPTFDVDSFVSGVSQRATAGAQLDLESSINEILSSSGITESGNSMSALLANRLRNQTASNLAGIEAEATATGEGIRLAGEQQLTEGIRGLSTDLQSSILNLVQSTRGARLSGRSSSKEHTWGTGTAEQSSNPFSAIGNIFNSFGRARGAA